jgi:hypothetical protein
MQIQALKETIRDAIGETKGKRQIGPLISVLMVIAPLELAMRMGDRLAARQRLQALAAHMGWHVTPSWVVWATKASY